jgi:predicted nucleotidyltransferase
VKTRPLRSPRLRGVLRQIKSALDREIGGRYRLILFGSHARNEGRPDSDVDLMAIVPDDLYSLRIKDRIRDIVGDFSIQSGYFFSVMIVSETTARRHEGFQVFASIEREGVPL